MLRRLRFPANDDLLFQHIIHIIPLVRRKSRMDTDFLCAIEFVKRNVVFLFTIDSPFVCMKHRIMLVFGLLAFLLVPSGPVTAATTVAARIPKSTILICHPTSRFTINQKEASQEDVGQFYTVVNPALGIVSRCEQNNRCSVIPSMFGSAGTYANIQSTVPNGFMMKIDSNGNYTEVSTLGLKTAVYSGICKISKL